MEELNLTRWVVVTSQHGEKYVGMIPEHVENAAQYFIEAVEKRQPVALHNARLMLAHYGAQGGNLNAGIQTMVAFIPIDLSDGPMEEINVVPSSWYFPPTSPSVISKFKRLIKAAEDAEQANRIRQAGLVTPGGRRGPLDA